MEGNILKNEKIVEEKNPTSGFIHPRKGLVLYTVSDVKINTQQCIQCPVLKGRVQVKNHSNAVFKKIFRNRFS